MLKYHRSSISSWIRSWKLNWQSEHFDLSRHAWQTFWLSRISGKYSKTFSMAFVMGISSAQASLLNVHEDFIDSSGVYAIVEFTSFHIFCHTGFRKNRKGVGAIFFGANCPSSSATGCRRRYFRAEIWLWQRFWKWRKGAGRLIQTKYWIVKSGEIGGTDQGIYSKGWIIIFPGGIRTRRSWCGLRLANKWFQKGWTLGIHLGIGWSQIA